MRKIIVFGSIFLLAGAISSPVCSQDTTTATKPATAGQSAAKKDKQNSKWEYFVNFTGRKVLGYTDYHIQFPGTIYISYDGGYTYTPAPVTGHSILSFPIDGYRIEGTVNARLNLPKKKALVFDLGLSTIISQPQKAMVDSDYIDLKDYGWPNWIQGATRSKVDYRNFDISIIAGYPILFTRKAHFIPKIGFQTSTNKFDVMGLAGWYSMYTPNDPYPVDSAYWAGEKVATYRVTYNRIVTGAQVKTNGEEGVYFSLSALFFPWVRATDHDDHLLRGKEADTKANGTGYSLGGRLEIPIHTTRTGSSLSVGGGYELLRITAKGSQQQRFYSDDPSTTEIETDYIFDPIDNTLRLRQNNIIAFIEYKL